MPDVGTAVAVGPQVTVGAAALIHGVTTGAGIPVTVTTGAASALIHEQTAPSASWVITHTLGHVPNVDVYLPTGEQVDVDVLAGTGGSVYVAGAGLAESPAGTFNVGAGTGITVAADTIAVDTSVVARKYTQDIGDGSSTSFNVTHGLGSQDVVVIVKVKATGEVVDCDISLPPAQVYATIVFPTAPTSAQYRVTVVG